MTEEQGLNIENNRDNIYTYFLFQIAGEKKVKWPYIDSDNNKQEAVKKLLIASYCRIIAANSNTKEVCFQQTYGAKKFGDPSFLVGDMKLIDC